MSNKYSSDILLILAGVLVLCGIIALLSYAIDTQKEEHRKNTERLKRRYISHEMHHRDEYKKLQDEAIERGYATITVDLETRKTQFEWREVNDESGTE